MSDSTINAVFKVAVGFVVGTLILLAGALYLSGQYLKEQQRLTAAGEVPGALEKARLAARLNPFDSAPLVAESSLLLRQGQGEAAAAALETAILRDPANYSNYVSLGNLQVGQLNDATAAAQSYREASERVPRDTNTLSVLAATLTRAGDFEGAKREYEKLRELEKIPPRDLSSLGQIYVRTGEPEKGIETFETARKKVSANLERSQGAQKAQRETFIQSMDLRIADALVVQGQYDEARAALENSDSELAPAIIELLNSDPEEYRRTVLNSEI